VALAGLVALTTAATFPPRFDNYTIQAGALSARGLAAADMDNDGRVDAVAALTGSGTVVWYKNGGAWWCLSVCGLEPWL
jgi:hypothetical protein